MTPNEIAETMATSRAVIDSGLVPEWFRCRYGSGGVTIYHQEWREKNAEEYDPSRPWRWRVSRGRTEAKGDARTLREAYETARAVAVPLGLPMPEIKADALTVRP